MSKLSTELFSDRQVETCKRVWESSTSTSVDCNTSWVNEIVDLFISAFGVLLLQLNLISVVCVYLLTIIIIIWHFYVTPMPADGRSLPTCQIKHTYG